MEAKTSELSASSRLLSVLSHPFYLSHFIFFFPDILNLCSFLFPLVIAISLLLLALYTLSLFSAFQPFFEDFEACRNENGENPDGFGDEGRAELSLPMNFPPLIENFQENKEPESTQISELKKNEEEEKKMSVSIARSMGDSQAPGLSNDGKEREWRRTLAGKLHEERRSVEENSERMDLLCDTHEKEAARNRRSSSRKSKNGGLEQEKREKESEPDEEEDSNGDLCC